MAISGLIQLLHLFRCKKTKTGTRALSYCVMSLKTRAFATVLLTVLFCVFTMIIAFHFETENDGKNNFYMYHPVN